MISCYVNESLPLSKVSCFVKINYNWNKQETARLILEMVTEKCRRKVRKKSARRYKEQRKGQSEEGKENM